MPTLYGISNCDTIKKARKWLEQRGVQYTFHDYKKSGVTKDMLENWALEIGEWEPLLNRRGTTFRKLPEIVRENVNENTALQLMVENPSMIKRPVLEYDGGVMVGFKGTDYETALGLNQD